MVKDVCVFNFVAYISFSVELLDFFDNFQLSKDYLAERRNDEKI